MASNIQTNSITKVIKIIERDNLRDFNAYILYKKIDMHYNTIKKVLAYLEEKEYIVYNEISKSYSKKEDN